MPAVVTYRDRVILSYSLIEQMATRLRQRVSASADTQAKNRARRMITALKKAMPTAVVELDYTTPLELLMATILSAQCTDVRVNMVTPTLFQRYRQAADYANADPAELESIIRSTGFFKSKARHIIACARMLVERFHGQVPDTMEALVSLPGIGRKTANVLLGCYFGKPAVMVDTHVKRIAYRLGLTCSTDPTQIEEDLQQLLPRSLWTGGSQRLLLHGRYVCVARKPKCQQCSIYRDCSWEGKQTR